MDLLTKEEVEKIVKTEKGYFHYVIQPASDKPIGFLGIHYRLIVNFSNEKKIYFIKTIPKDNPNQYEYVVSSGAFAKEVESYNKLFKDIDDATEGISWHPRCFYTRNDIIVLEDLAEQNFILFPNKRPLDYDHVKVLLKTIAAMHGRCLVFEQKISEKKIDSVSEHFKTLGKLQKIEIKDLYPTAVRETVYNEEEPQNMFTKWMAIAVDEISNAIADDIDGYTSNQRDLIRKNLPNVLRQAFVLTKPSKKFKNIFNHGDLWLNNILFKYENSKPVEARILDYQLARYIPPAHDVMDVFYLTATKKFRESHEKELIKFYYRELKKVIKENGYLLSDIIPWESFIESCEYYRKFGLIRAGIMLNTIIAPPEVIEKGFETNEEYEKFALYERGRYIKLSFEYEDYKERISEIFHEIIQNYVLKNYEN